MMGICITKCYHFLLSAAGTCSNRQLLPSVWRYRWARWLKRQGAWLRAGRPGFDPRCRRGGDFSSLLRVQTGPGVHSTSYQNECRGCEYVDPCIHIPRGPSWPVMGIPLPFWRYSVVLYTPSVSYATVNITFTAHCVGCTFFGPGELGCFHSFDFY